MTVVRTERPILHYNSVSISFQNWNEEIMWKIKPGSGKKASGFLRPQKMPTGFDCFIRCFSVLQYFLQSFFLWFYFLRSPHKLKKFNVGEGRYHITTATRNEIVVSPPVRPVASHTTTIAISFSVTQTHWESW